MPQATYLLAAHIMDRFLAVRMVDPDEIRYKEVALASSYIVCSVGEDGGRRLRELVAQQPGISQRTVGALVIEIMITLDYRFRCPTASEFAYDLLSEQGPETCLIGFFLVEMAVANLHLMSERPSKIAAAAVSLARSIALNVPLYEAWVSSSFLVHCER